MPASGLEVYDWSEEAGGNIDEWNYWGGDCQKWRLIEAEKNRRIPHHFLRCLDHYILPIKMVMQAHLLNVLLKKLLLIHSMEQRQLIQIMQIPIFQS